MKKRPILYSGPMVRASLREEGPKTQTRRQLKIQPSETHVTADRESHLCGVHIEIQEGCAWAVFEYTMGEIEAFPCPYGQPGDHLWGRETLRRRDGVWCYDADNETVTLDRDDPAVPAMLSWAHHKEGNVCVSIHMPRWASRLTQEILCIRVERLQDISEEDALAEGVEPGGRFPGHARGAYSDLWDQINGPGAWARNPWVWVVEFKRVTQEVALSA